MQKIPVLTYHSIDESGSVISTGAATFRRQMKFLKSANYNVVSLGDLIKDFRAGKKLPSRTIVLTFDDGFQNFYATAFPILADYDFTATVFLVAAHCEKYNVWDEDWASIERRPLMSWSEIKELQRNGIEFGGHSLTHPDLTNISLKEAKRELVDSKAVIEDRLGCAVETFAYPYGKFNAEVKRLTEEHYAAACSTNLGKVRAESDFYSLRRVDAYYLQNERIFKSVESFSFDLYLQIRQAMRNLKKVFA